MEFFGISWSIIIVYLLGVVGVPILMEIMIHTKWWKNKSEYYFSFNKDKDKDEH